MPDKRTKKSRKGQTSKERTEAITRELFASFLQSDLADLQADYLNRGRKYKNLKDEDLHLVWAHAFRMMVDTKSKQMRMLMSDLRAELGLRGLQPDLEQVKPEYNRWTATIEREIEEGSGLSPEVLRKINDYIHKARRKPN
jgi:hypothetical protein